MNTFKQGIEGVDVKDGSVIKVKAVNTVIRIDRSMIYPYIDGVVEVKDPDLEYVGPAEYDMAKSEILSYDDYRKGRTLVTGRDVYDFLKETGRLRECYGYDDAIAIRENGYEAFRQVFGQDVILCWRTVMLNKYNQSFVPCMSAWGPIVILKTVYVGDFMNSQMPIVFFR